MCVVAWALAYIALAAVAVRAQSVTVVQLQLQYNELHLVRLNNSVEYILEFEAQPHVGREIPSLVWVQSDGGDIAHPVQRLGSCRTRWKAASSSSWSVRSALTTRLQGAPILTLSAGQELDQSGQRHAFSLHLSTSCATDLTVSVRGTLPTWAPRVLYYKMAEEELQMRLVVTSQSELCATLSVHNYSCPIPQTLDEIESVGLRLTMMKSGALQLSREQYPSGFYVVLTVWQSDDACGAGESIGGDDVDWLWPAALWGEVPSSRSVPDRRKEFTVTLKPALSRSQYVVAGVVTLAIFAGFYVLFGVLVLAQRWPAFARYVAPQAVLAVPGIASVNSTAVTTGEVESPGLATTRHRRGSTDTYDRSDDSDTDIDDEDQTDLSVSEAGQQRSLPAQGQNQVQGPFGLPSRLRLAALSRLRARTLRARSDRYLYMLYIVAVFYALPVIQFVIAFQVVMNVSGSLDICYYNFLCAHPAGAVSDFNHVFSNLGYLMLGALFLLQVRRRRARRQKLPRDEEYGIPAHYGLLSALGAGMMVVALLYGFHVRTGGAQHGEDLPGAPPRRERACARHLRLVWGVLGGGPVFWGVFTVLHIFTFLLLSCAAVHARCMAHACC
ncbi:unnamed protein product [Leptidea sinapis]|uniref:SID1 transmembrane family member 1 n=1 Tax=Leptidea sinapis TaxID=189913 RepID=A0A5E4Q663_9NEOP|nr:unnamed protein product [Leptidea sinapis]